MLFQGTLADIQEAGATLVAIPPQTPTSRLPLAERRAVEYPVLSDADNAVAKQYGLAFTAADAVIDTMRKHGKRLPHPGGWSAPRTSSMPLTARWRTARDSVRAKRIARSSPSQS